MTMNSLPPGFRFHPTDVELIKFYLQRKVMGKRVRFEVMAEIDIYKFAPWDLPDKSYMRSKDMEWYFYCPRERKYSSGGRMNRATEFGYWKTTGKDRTVINNGKTVGMIKTLIFHTGRAPKGDRTDWVMHEYRLEDKNLADAFVVQDAYVLCKIFEKSGPGPKNGAQYGAPFIEEEWSDDEAVYGTSSFHLADMSVPVPVLQKNQNNSAVTNTYIPGPTCIEASVSCANTFQDTNASMNEFPPICDDVLSMLDCFDDDFGLVPFKDHNNEIMNNVNPDETGQNASMDVNYIYQGLGELGQWKELSENDLYLELNDLQMPLVGTPNHTYESSFDPVLSHYDLYNISDQPSYPLNSIDTDQDASTINQSLDSFDTAQDASTINQSLDSFDTAQDASIINQSLVLPEGFLWP